jgi:mycothiol synthase
VTTPIELRALTAADIPAWNHLLAEVEKVEQTGEHYNEADLAEEMANPDIEIGKDIVGAFVAGDLAGYFAVYPRSVTDEHHKIHLEGTVRPDLRGQGVGTVLASAMRRRALEAHNERHPARPVKLMLRGLSDNADQARLMADVGLAPERWSFGMRADLTRQVPTPSLVPEGLELHRYDDSVSAAMQTAHNAAFVDHPNFTPWSDSEWRQWVTDSRNFRPKLSFVVLDPARDAQVAAYVQTNEYDAYYQMTGKREAYVAKVGTRREYRGRGLASTLLGHALHEYAASGFDEAALDVDSENPTGALGIYERTGFAVESRWTDYAARLDPEEARQASTTE